MQHGQDNRLFTDLGEPQLPVMRAAVRRWYLLLAFAALGVAASWSLVRRMPPIYSASAQILIEPTRTNFAGTSVEFSSSSLYFFYRNEIQTQILLVESKAVAKRVLDELGLANPDGPFENSPDPVMATRSMMTVTPVGETRSILVTTQAPTPELAAETADAFSRAYIAESLESRRALLKETMLEYASRIPELDEQLQDAEERLAEFQKQHMDIPVDRPEESLRQEENKLLEDLGAARRERVQAEAAMRQFEEISPEISMVELARTVAAEDPWVRQVLDARLTQGAVVLDLRKYYSDGQRDLESAKTRLQEIERELDNAVRGYYGRIQRMFESARWKEDEIQRLLSAHRAKANEVRQWLSKYETLRYKRDSYRNLLNPLARGQAETGLAASIDLANARILEPATPPNAPSGPRRMRYVAVGLIMGLGLGFGLSLLLEMTDFSIRAIDDVAKLGGPPIFGTISVAPRSLSSDPKVFARIASAQPGSLQSEQFRSIRTGLQSSSAWAEAGPGRVALITSPNMGEGKSTLAANLAQTFAQLGHLTILVDADLRRGRIAEIFDLDESPGLAELIAGEVSEEDVLRSNGIENLRIITSGSTLKPAELLASPQLAEVIGSLRKKDATIIIDTPPVLPVSDTRSLVRLCDALLVLVKPYHTPRRSLQRVIELLKSSGATNVGVILNGTPPSLEREYGYGNRHYRQYEKRSYVASSRAGSGQSSPT